ncbi:hypothetical protein AOL_s00088g23 [Orbilia oligospora ATCC 24927]|uniref:Uncharacterized protein n=1 Tax=Arthrobotrys oligospora (strain ATCC 24927 / CBS 115.81 / DSM 1491) TaxID=756982 RepID=G1XHR0_ARTOA|nr:hypothetical protein AOL_s00088g23 [Orbilia oligospora ATCC 24927]EGX47308.1 hypothetical protein AOL_s00088g23 [Orbilia oligospora ATCC 24927]
MNRSEDLQLIQLLENSCRLEIATVTGDDGEPTRLAYPEIESHDQNSNGIWQPIPKEFLIPYKNANNPSFNEYLAQVSLHNPKGILEGQIYQPVHRFIQNHPYFSMIRPCIQPRPPSSSPPPPPPPPPSPSQVPRLPISLNIGSSALYLRRKSKLNPKRPQSPPPATSYDPSTNPRERGRLATQQYSNPPLNYPTTLNHAPNPSKYPMQAADIRRQSQHPSLSHVTTVTMPNPINAPFAFPGPITRDSCPKGFRASFRAWFKCE